MIYTWFEQISYTFCWIFTLVTFTHTFCTHFLYTLLYALVGNFTCDGGEENADDGCEADEYVHGDHVPGVVAAQVVLGLLPALGHHGPLLVVPVPDTHQPNSQQMTSYNGKLTVDVIGKIDIREYKPHFRYHSNNEQG